MSFSKKGKQSDQLVFPDSTPTRSTRVVSTYFDTSNLRDIQLIDEFFSAFHSILKENHNCFDHFTKKNSKDKKYRAQDYKQTIMLIIFRKSGRIITNKEIKILKKFGPIALLPISREIEVKDLLEYSLVKDTDAFVKEINQLIENQNFIRLLNPEQKEELKLGVIIANNLSRT